MQNNFEISLKHVLKYEGGYSDHPLDPGGATNLGITRRVLAAYRGRPVSKAEVRNLSRCEAGAIYRQNYWDKCKCDKLPSGIDLAVFDCAVNQGTRRAAKFLQKAVHAKADGIIGPETLQGVCRMPHDEILMEFIARRMQSYWMLQRLFRTFGLGWSRRLIATHAAALRLI